MKNEVFNETNIAQKEASQRNTLLEKMKGLAAESENFNGFYDKVKKQLGWLQLSRILSVLAEAGGGDLQEFYEKHSESEIKDFSTSVEMTEKKKPTSPPSRYKKESQTKRKKKRETKDAGLLRSARNDEEGVKDAEEK